MATADRDLYLGVGMGVGAGAGLVLTGVTEEWAFLPLGFVLGVIVSFAVYQRAAR